MNDNDKKELIQRVQFIWLEDIINRIRAEAESKFGTPESKIETIKWLAKQAKFARED